MSHAKAQRRHRLSEQKLTSAIGFANVYGNVANALSAKTNL